jgi:serine/threonine protein phosphatase 1
VWQLLKPKPRKRRPRVPPGIRIYAVGDVHGCIDLLDRALTLIDEDLRRDPVERPIHVFLGDYVDRGPNSRQTVERLIVRSRTHESVLLKGNHETFVFAFLNDPAVLHHWRQYGGLETLISYGLKPSLNASAAEQQELAAAFRQRLPEHHEQFFGELKPWFSCGDFFFAHAGVRPGVPLAQQREEDLLWIRDDFLLCEDDHGKIIVHGHSPVLEPDIRPNRINIDTGAYATGKLTCLVIDGERTTVL